MMAKMFYTLDEARAALGRSEEDIKQFAREGRLREFRDGPRLMFKADQVEQLKADLGANPDQVDLGSSDSGGMIGLVDTTGASGTSITLSDTDGGGGQSSGAGMQLKDDTALASDLGLAGSIGGSMTASGTGIPSPARPAPGASGSGMGAAGLTGTGMSMSGSGMSMTGTGMSMTGTGRAPGVNVFGGEDLEGVDPSAQTSISSGTGREQINLEGVGSGSGLLDLTRESDDTSLGSVLDEITPGGTGRRTAVDIPAGSGLAEIDEPSGSRAMGAPIRVERLDPAAPAFGAASLAGFIVLLVGVLALMSAVTGTRPGMISFLATKGLLMTFGMGIGLAIVLGVIGLIVGRSVRR